MSDRPTDRPLCILLKIFCNVVADADAVVVVVVGGGICLTVQIPLCFWWFACKFVRKLSATRVSSITYIYVWLVCQRHNPYLFNTFILLFISFVRSFVCWFYFAYLPAFSLVLVSFHCLFQSVRPSMNSIIGNRIGIIKMYVFVCVCEWRICNMIECVSCQRERFETFYSFLSSFFNISFLLFSFVAVVRHRLCLRIACNISNVHLPMFTCLSVYVCQCPCVMCGVTKRWA